MLISPQLEAELIDPIRTALFEAGIEKEGVSELASTKKNELINALNKNGASLDHVAAALGISLADNNQRLRAADLILRAYGLFQPEGETSDNRITVLVNGDNAQVAAILNPRRESYKL